MQQIIETVIEHMRYNHLIKDIIYYILRQRLRLKNIEISA